MCSRFVDDFDWDTPVIIELFVDSIYSCFLSIRSKLERRFGCLWIIIKDFQNTANYVYRKNRECFNSDLSEKELEECMDDLRIHLRKLLELMDYFLGRLYGSHHISANERIISLKPFSKIFMVN